MEEKRQLFKCKGEFIAVDLDDLEQVPCKWDCGAKLLVIPTSDYDPALLALNSEIRLHGQFVETVNGIIYEGHPLDSARQWEEANRFQSHWCAMRRRECKSCGASIRIGLRPPEEDRAGINSLRFMNWEPVLGGVLTVDHDGYVVVDKQATRGYEPHNCKERRNG